MCEYKRRGQRTDRTFPLLTYKSRKPHDIVAGNRTLQQIRIIIIPPDNRRFACIEYQYRHIVVDHNMQDGVFKEIS